MLSKFDVSSFSLSGDILIFKLVILLTLSSSKSIFLLFTLVKSKLTLFIPFYYFEQVTVILLSLGNTCRKNNPNPLRLIKNSRTTNRIWHKSFSIIQSAESRTGFISQKIGFKVSVFYFFL